MAWSACRGAADVDKVEADTAFDLEPRTEVEEVGDRDGSTCALPEPVLAEVLLTDPTLLPSPVLLLPLLLPLASACCSHPRE